MVVRKNNTQRENERAVEISKRTLKSGQWSNNNNKNDENGESLPRRGERMERNVRGVFASVIIFTGDFPLL